MLAPADMVGFFELVDFFLAPVMADGFFFFSRF
jgi:hypothetical protein